MKIFFTASQRGKAQFGKNYERIQEAVRNNGYVLLDDDILANNADELFAALEKGDHKKQVEFYNKKIDSIKRADLCIFEASVHSLSIGFVIQKALELNKPTIVFYVDGNRPIFFSGVENEKLILQEYDENNLEKKVKLAFEEALHLREKRFNFFISPQLLTYLEGASKKEGITKSTFIRNLIIAHKKKNS